MIKFVKDKIHKFLKLIQWHLNVFCKDVDYDAHSLYSIIEYKLKRTHKALIEGVAIHDVRDMKALKLAIKISGRLKEDTYEEVTYARLDRKWGEAKLVFKPTEHPQLSKLHVYRKGVLESNTKEFRMNLIKAGNDAYNRMKREEKWLYAILYKYLRYWWD